MGKTALKKLNILLALTGLLLFAYIGNAFAWSVSENGGVLTVSAAPGEVNRFVLDDFDPANFKITDGGGNAVDAATLPSAFCAQTGISQVRCTPLSLRLVVRAGDGDDRIDNNSSLLGVTLDGGDGKDTINGSNEDETIVGGDGNDQIYANGGDDDIDAGAGEDSVVAGKGSDSISGGSGDDSLIGSSGDDLIKGNSGRDSINGNDGNDTLEGNEDADTIFGENGEDRILGGDGDDVLSGAESNDFIDGQEGQDTHSGGEGTNVLQGGPGESDMVSYEDAGGPVFVSLDDKPDDGVHNQNDNVGSDVENVVGSQFDDTIWGNEQANELSGNHGDDRIYGLGGADRLSGDFGDDRLDGGLQGDLLLGGEGVDTAVYSDRTQPLFVTMGGSADDGEANESDDVQTENLVTGSANDVIHDDHLTANVIDAGPGDDRIFARTGSPLIDNLVCGEGQDAADIDPVDQLASDCETIVTALPSGPINLAGQTNARAKLLGSEVRVNQRGHAPIRLRCDGPKGSVCSGELRIEAYRNTWRRMERRVSKSHNPHKKPSWVRLKKQRYSVPAGKTVTIKLKLPQGHTRTLRSHPKRKLPVRVTLRDSGSTTSLATARAAAKSVSLKYVPTKRKPCGCKKKETK